MNDKTNWNRVIKSNGGSFLQSWEWGDFQKKLGREILRINEVNLTGLFIKYPMPLGYSYLYSPRLFLKSKYDVKDIEEFIKPLDYVFIKIDPHCDIKYKSALCTEPLQPEFTQIVDIYQDEDKILSSMNKDTRYSIRTAEKRGVKTITIKDTSKEELLRGFLTLIEVTNDRQGISSYGRSYYSNLFDIDEDMKTEILLSYVDGQYVASAFMVYFNDTATYLFAGSNSKFSKYNAPTFLIWNAMLEAKKKGYKKFDLWGISHTKPKWARITSFKKGFGGEEARYPSSIELPLHNIKYSIYKLVKSIR